MPRMYTNDELTKLAIHILQSQEWNHINELYLAGGKFTITKFSNFLKHNMIGELEKAAIRKRPILVG